MKAGSDELVEWWLNTAREDINSAAEKIVEYGGHGPAQDLLQVGHDLAKIAGREVGDGEAQELGIWFYLRSKLARWHTAILEGRRPSDDTLLDIAFYAMMARRVRSVGAWPWPEPLAAPAMVPLSEFLTAPGSPGPNYSSKIGPDPDDSRWCENPQSHRGHDLATPGDHCYGVWAKQLSRAKTCGANHQSHPAHYWGDPDLPNYCRGNS